MSLTRTTISSRLSWGRNKTCWWMRCHGIRCNIMRYKMQEGSFFRLRLADLSQWYAVPLPKRTNDDSFYGSTWLFFRCINRVSVLLSISFFPSLCFIKTVLLDIYFLAEHVTRVVSIQSFWITRLHLTRSKHYTIRQYNLEKYSIDIYSLSRSMF